MDSKATSSFISGTAAVVASSRGEMSGVESLLEYDEIVRKMFGNEEEGFQFYNSYAKEKGFSVRRSYCEWDNGHNEMTLRKFVCSREGFREEKELKRENRKRKARNITRVGCRAFMNFYLPQSPLKPEIQELQVKVNAMNRIIEDLQKNMDAMSALIQDLTKKT